MISRETLAQFGEAATAPGKTEKNFSRFEMEAYLAKHAFKVLRQKSWSSHPGGAIYELEQCPFNPDHTSGSAAFTEVNGKPGFTCKHDGCFGKTIRDVFALYPPELSDAASTGEDSTQSQTLIRLSSDVELFHTPSDEAYARYKVGGHFEIGALRAKSFRQWLIKRFYDSCGKPPGSQAFQDAVGILEAKAQFEGPEMAVGVRVAEHGDRIYIDLCNKDWEVVEISREGWRVVAEAPVRFRRARGMRPLPKPQTGGSVLRLRKLINIGDDDNWILLASWLVAACRPTGPYPVLVLHGEHGSAKSTLERIIRLIIDPSSAPVRTPPRGDRDLLIAATNSWVIAYDNLSGIPLWLSDSICRLATGGGFSTRELYTDSEEVFFDAVRPVVLNGIDHLTERADLADRSIILNLPMIEKNDRKTEKKVYREFEEARPQVLGALYTAVSAALERLPRTEVPGMPRMADFALWATAAELALGFSDGDFLRAYDGNRVEAIQETLEADAVATAMQAFMEGQELSWRGSCKDLKKHLDESVEDGVKKSDSWPKTPRALSGRLRRLVTFLRESGIDVVFPPKSAKAAHGQRLFTVTRTTAQSTATTATSATQTDNHSGGQSVREGHPGGGPEDRVADEPPLARQPPPDWAAAPLKIRGKRSEVAEVAVVAVDYTDVPRAGSLRDQEDPLYHCSSCGQVAWVWKDSAWVCPRCGAPAAGQRARDSDTERFEL